MAIFICQVTGLLISYILADVFVPFILSQVSADLFADSIFQFLRIKGPYSNHIVHGSRQYFTP